MGVNDDREKLEAAIEDNIRLQGELGNALQTNEEDLRYIKRIERDLPVAVLELTRAGVPDLIIAGAAKAVLQLTDTAALSIADAATVAARAATQFDLTPEAIATLAESGRRLASERDDLIATGINPSDLSVPLHPTSAPESSMTDREQYEAMCTAFERVSAELRTTLAERDAALAVIEQVRARFEKPMHPYGDKKFAMVPEKAFLADAYGEDIVQDVDAILAQSPASALAKVKADTLREAALRQPWYGAKGDDFMTWLNEDADRVEKQAERG